MFEKKTKHKKTQNKQTFAAMAYKHTFNIAVFKFLMIISRVERKTGVSQMVGFPQT